MDVLDMILGLSCNVSGKVINISPKVLHKAYLDTNGMPINPFSCNCPKSMIQTGISTIDTMNSSARDQKEEEEEEKGRRRRMRGG